MDHVSRGAVRVDVTAMVNAYTAGASVRAVAEAYHVGYGTAWRRLSEHIVLRSRNQRRGSEASELVRMTGQPTTQANSVKDGG